MEISTLIENISNNSLNGLKPLRVQLLPNPKDKEMYVAILKSQSRQYS